MRRGDTWAPDWWSPTSLGTEFTCDASRRGCASNPKN